MASEKWLCSYLTKYFIPGYDNSTLMEGEYENSNVQ